MAERPDASGDLIKQYAEELARLRAELERLRRENERLRKVSPLT